MSQVQQQPPPKSPYLARLNLVAGTFAVIGVIAAIAYGGYRVYQRQRQSKGIQQIDVNVDDVASQLALRGEFDAAVELFSGLVKDNPTHEPWKAEYGRVLNAAGDFEKSIEVLEQCREEFPFDYHTEYFLACSYASLEDWPNAISAMERYLLAGGQYPLPDNQLPSKLSASHQLERLPEIEEFNRLADNPLRFLGGGFNIIDRQQNVTEHVGGASGMVWRDLPLAEFHANIDGKPEKSWVLTCTRDDIDNTWRLTRHVGDGSLEEYQGDVTHGLISLAGRRIPPGGGPETPCKIILELSDPQRGILRFQVFRSYDGSGDWTRAHKEIEFLLNRY